MSQSGGKKQRKHKGGFLGLDNLFGSTDQSQGYGSGYYAPGEVSRQPPGYQYNQPPYNQPSYNQPSTNYMNRLSENIRNVGQSFRNNSGNRYSNANGSNYTRGLSRMNYMSGGIKTHRKKHKGRSSHRGGKKSRKNKSTRKHRKH